MSCRQKSIALYGFVRNLKIHIWLQFHCDFKQHAGTCRGLKTHSWIACSQIWQICCFFVSLQHISAACSNLLDMLWTLASTFPHKITFFYRQLYLITFNVELSLKANYTWLWEWTSILCCATKFRHCLRKKSRKSMPILRCCVWKWKFIIVIYRKPALE